MIYVGPNNVRFNVVDKYNFETKKEIVLRFGDKVVFNGYYNIGYGICDTINVRREDNTLVTVLINGVKVKIKSRELSYDDMINDIFGERIDISYNYDECISEIRGKIKWCDYHKELVIAENKINAMTKAVGNVYAAFIKEYMRADYDFSKKPIDCIHVYNELDADKYPNYKFNVGIDFCGNKKVITGVVDFSKKDELFKRYINDHISVNGRYHKVILLSINSLRKLGAKEDDIIKIKRAREKEYKKYNQYFLDNYSYIIYTGMRKELEDYTMCIKDIE